MLFRSASASRQTNKFDNLYNCQIEINANHWQLNRKTIQVVVGDQNRSLWFENFSDECPLLSADPCAPYS